MKIVSLLLGFSLAINSLVGAPVAVEIRKTGGGCQLMRDGLPYFIKGAGGNASLEALKAAGGNSIRTWGADNLEAVLDQAQKLGITVTVGIWLGHERQGFKYTDANQVARQLDQVRQVVTRFKDHPAVLMWGLGNEMEEPDGANAAVWSAINNIAEMVKKLDPNHPTMTVIAELGGDRIKNIERLCPDIDAIGINSYGGAASLAERYAKLNGSKPYVVTEFGPAGAWETPKTPWGAPVEASSTAKAEAYRRTYKGAIEGKPLCLGSYAFIWGHKQEATATWFGMFLPDGRKLGAVDVMTELWSGKPPVDLCPQIKGLSLTGSDQLKPGMEIAVALDATNPAGKPLKVHWVLQPEQAKMGVGGDAEPELPALTHAVVQSDERHAVVRAPEDGGGYRLFAYVQNDCGAAVANVPFFVDAPIKVIPAKTASLPFVVYEDQGSTNNHYIPAGWMGNAKALEADEGCTIAPHGGKTCIRYKYAEPGDWAGVVWQDPVGDWGEAPGGWNLTGARHLVFWARGEKGGETVSFKCGILGADKKYHDSASAGVDGIKLTREWKQYLIDLGGRDLSRIKTGFVWTVAGQGQSLTFYLDDISYGD